MNPRLSVGLLCLYGLGCSALAADGEGAAVASGDGQLGAQSQALHRERPVGLSLAFNNGVGTAKELIGRGPRYVQEIDIVESVPTTSDEGIEPLIAQSRLSALDWSGVEQVEEIWVPSLDGTFTRERYYRGARWMEQRAVFRLDALGPGGAVLGAPWIVRAGRDDVQRPGDDMFIRRFNARQLAFGCPSPGDCTGAAFLAEGSIQVRGALHPVADARRVPARIAALRLSYNRLPGVTFSVDAERVAPSAAPFAPGFQVDLEALTAPANGTYYEPGEAVSFRVSFLDGSGQPLHPEGQLPTYGEYAAGGVESGLRYLDLTLQTRLYYSLKHRESNLLMVLSGPTSELQTPQTVVDPSLFFGPQVPFATTSVDGFTAVGQTIPPASIIFGGLSDPSLWSLPVSDVVTFTIPPDAQPGTYVAAIKARRDYAGEALNRGATLEIQVGQAAPTVRPPTTTCSPCHGEGGDSRTSFATLLHGLEDRRTCFGCHASLGVEFDNALDIRVHAIHHRSDRFDADIQDCSLCHLSPPSGPQRGVLP